MAKLTKQKQWMGSAPSACDICHIKITDTFIDGRTRFGPWGNMCPGCHRDQGCGLGMGNGQKYVKTGNVWYKVEG